MINIAYIYAFKGNEASQLCFTGNQRKKACTLCHVRFSKYHHRFLSKKILQSQDLTCRSQLWLHKCSAQYDNITRATSKAFWFITVVRDLLAVCPLLGPRKPELRLFQHPWKGREGSGWDRHQSSPASQGTETQTPSDKGNQYDSQRRALAWHRISNEQKASSCLKITPWALYQSSPHLMQASAEGIFPSRPSTSFSNIFCLRSVVYTIYRTCQG